jgi:prophage tail gpP-like protein
VDGGEYAGWTQVEVERSLDRFAHSFDLGYTDRWSEAAEPWPIRPGATAQIKYGNHILITGWVEASTFSAQRDQWRLRAQGRSLTGDLVDCGALFKTGNWNNQLLRVIANDLVSPYGLAVELSIPDNEPIRKFTIEMGESVYDALERLVRNRGYLLTTHPDGNVGLVRLLDFVGSVVDVPVADAISRELSEDAQDVHSQYLLRSQSYGADEFGLDVTIRRTFDGQPVTGMRHRPMVLFADSASSREELAKRAAWEQNVRYGRSVRVRYSLPGVLDPRGLPWAPATQYFVNDPVLGVEERLLCVRANVHVDNGDLMTDIELTRPEAFSLLEWPDDVLNLVTKLGRPKVKRAPIKKQQKG